MFEWNVLNLMDLTKQREKNQFTPQELDYPDSGRLGLSVFTEKDENFSFTKSGSVVTWADSMGETFSFQRRLFKEKLFLLRDSPFSQLVVLVLLDFVPQIPGWT